MTERKTHGLKQHNENLNKVICDSLQEALIFLMNQKPFQSISITELCKKAGVSRMAFYGNFQTKEELLKQIVLKRSKKLIEKIGSPFRKATGVIWYEKMFESVREDEYYLRTIFDAGFKVEYLSIMNSLVLHDTTIPSTKKYMRVIWAGGIVNTIIYWLENGMQESTSDIAKLCYDNLSVWTN